MLAEYINQALKRAKYEKLDDDGTFVGEVPGLQGVLVNAATFEACRNEVASAVEDWVLFRIANGMKIPKLGGITVSVTRVG